MKIVYENYGDYEIVGDINNHGQVAIVAILNGDEVMKSDSYISIIEKIDARDKRLEKKNKKAFEVFKVVSITYEEIGKVKEITSFTEDGKAWAKSKDGREKLTYGIDEYFPIAGNEEVMMKIKEEIDKKKAIDAEVKATIKTMKNLETIIKEYLA